MLTDPIHSGNNSMSGKQHEIQLSIVLLKNNHDYLQVLVSGRLLHGENSVHPLASQQEVSGHSDNVRSTKLHDGLCTGFKIVDGSPDPDIRLDGVD
ncbi:hypothetical protein BGZ83_011988, partial [Gryganskiella cystojenkinii]